MWWTNINEIIINLNLLTALENSTSSFSSNMNNLHACLVTKCGYALSLQEAISSLFQKWIKIDPKLRYINYIDWRICWIKIITNLTVLINSSIIKVYAEEGTSLREAIILV